MLSAARTGAAVLAAVLLCGLAAGPALADAASPSPSPVAAPAALYGRSDPTYDGVWRQSLALTALANAKVTPADSAVGWLTGQQCADGGWPSFRAWPTPRAPRRPRTATLRRWRSRHWWRLAGTKGRWTRG